MWISVVQTHNVCVCVCVGSVHLLNDGTAQHQQQQLSDVSFDNWEIDPRSVELGVEIGQGAFGRVLTGFYRNQQVAIKVLKGMCYLTFYYYCYVRRNLTLGHNPPVRSPSPQYIHVDGTKAPKVAGET